MAIAGISEDDIRAILNEHLTPSTSIKTPERLFGRERNLTAISRALNSSGRQIFIHGDRGVGKTSLAQTAAVLHTHSSQEPIYTVCGKTSTFGDVIQDIGHRVISVEKRLEKAANGRGVNLSFAGSGVGWTEGSPSVASIPKPDTITEAMDVIRFVATRSQSPLVIVVDEMERIASAEEREKFGEFIKNTPELGDDVRFIFCGIANDINELLESHPSAGRILETIKLNRLHHSDLWQILNVVAGKLGVTVSRETLVRISLISDGFPHFVHLIGESMFWHMWDDPDDIQQSRSVDYMAGIAGAIQRTEEVLKAAYEKATMKTKNTKEYELALWALGDTTSDRRQLSEIYDASLRRLEAILPQNRQISRDTLNQRLLALKKDAHGRVVVGYGSGWFGFRENIMRGYVRLRAESDGIELGRDQSTAATI